MLYKEPTKEAKPLSAQNASQLKKNVQEAAMHLEKEEFDSKTIEEIVYRLLTVRNDLLIDAKQDVLRLIRISGESRQIIHHDLKKLEDLIIYEKQTGFDDSREAILNLFPSDMIGEAFIHAVHASCRLEELQNKKDKKTQERAFNNFLHLIHCLNILENPQKAMNALQKRQTQYQKQIEANRRNIENAKTKGQDSDIPRSEANIKHFEAKIDWLKPHFQALDETIQTTH